MIFEYDELKEYIKNDFEEFYNIEESEKGTYLAILDEYQYAKDFCKLECICIHIFLILNYMENGLVYDFLVEKLNDLLKNEEDNIKVELGDEYKLFLEDILKIRKNNYI